MSCLLFLLLLAKKSIFLCSELLDLCGDIVRLALRILHFLLALLDILVVVVVVGFLLLPPVVLVVVL